MADSRIKGITIELDGETTGLQKALSDVTKQSMDIQKELKDVDRLLKFDPCNVEAMAQKQKLLASQIEVTSEKLNRLRAAEQQVNEQFEKGDIGEAQFRAFRREVEYTETSLEKLKKTLSKVDDASSLKTVENDLSKVAEESDGAGESIKGLGGELTNLIAGAAAGMGIKDVIEKALDTSSLDTKIKVSMAVPEESIVSIKDAINTVSSYGIDAETALEGVRTQWTLNKDASDEANAATARGAATIAAAYSGVDFTELIQKSSQLSKTLGISNDEALALINSLLKTGFPPDQIDIIQEYGTQLKMAGYNAEEIQALFAAGVNTGTWNIDNLMDGLKEGRIKVAEFGQAVPKAMEGLIAGTSISSKQLQDWGKAVAAGGEGGSKAMTEIATALQGVDDETKKNALGVAIFGTMYEDQGKNITDTLINAKGATVDLKAGQDALNASTAQLNSDPAIMMKQAMLDLQLALAPLYESLAGIIAMIAGWIQSNPELSATIIAIVTTLGILIGICMGIAPIFTAISTAAGVLGISMAAIAWPVTIIVGVITALIAIGVLLYQNWDYISVKATEIWGGIKEVLSQTWESIKSTITTTCDNIKNYLLQSWQYIKTSMNATLTGIQGDMNRVWEFIKNIIITTLISITSALFQAWESIKTTTLNTWNNIKDFFIDLWNGIINTFETVISAILAFVITTWETILTNTYNIFNSIKDAIISIWNAIKTTVSTLVGSIMTTITDKFSALKGAVYEKMTWVKDSIIEVWNEAQAFLAGIDLIEIGKNAIQGLIDGITSMVGSVGDAIGNIADKITGGIRDALDIHSPSRVMKQLGIYTGEGFVLGIKSTIGDISRQSQAMANAVQTDINSGTVSTNANGQIGVSSSNGINQTVNIYSPSALSPSEIAKQNKRVLQELALVL